MSFEQEPLAHTLEHVGPFELGRLESVPSDELASLLQAASDTALRALPALKPWLALPAVIHSLTQLGDTPIEVKRVLLHYLSGLVTRGCLPRGEYEKNVSLEVLEHAVSEEEDGGHEASGSEWSVASGSKGASGFMRSDTRKLEVYRAVEGGALPVLLALLSSPETPAEFTSVAAATVAAFGHVPAVEQVIAAAVNSTFLEVSAAASASDASATMPFAASAASATGTEGSEATQCKFAALALAALRLGGYAASINWTEMQSTLFAQRRSIQSATRGKGMQPCVRNCRLSEPCGSGGEHRHAGGDQ